MHPLLLGGLTGAVPSREEPPALRRPRTEEQGLLGQRFYREMLRLSLGYPVSWVSLPLPALLLE